MIIYKTNTAYIKSYQNKSYYWKDIPAKRKTHSDHNDNEAIAMKASQKKIIKQKKRDNSPDNNHKALKAQIKQNESKLSNVHSQHNKQNALHYHMKSLITKDKLYS